jgi:two-component system chemotaxis response regulator CheY
VTPPRLLVADDSAVMRQMISAILLEAGYEVELAADGEKALEAARKHVFDLVVTDWTMIPMDGGELIRGLRALPGYERIPVVVLSTLSNAAVKSEARQAGANGWLCKPVNSATLVDVLASLLKRASVPSA